MNDLSTFDISFLISFIMGISLAACTGFRVFLPMLIGSIAFKMNWINPSQSFQWLGSTPAVIIFSVASVFEVLAYLIPWLDHALDVISGPLAVVAGSILASAVFKDMPMPYQIGLGIIAGGGISGAVQGATTLLRIGSTKFTGGLGNPIFSKIEAVAALFGSLIAIFAPILLFALILIFLFVAYKIIKKLITKPALKS